MSDIQVIAAAIVTAAGAIAAAIRWSVGRLAKAQDRGTDALIRNAESHAALAARFDVLAERLAERIDQLAERLDRVAEALDPPDEVEAARRASPRRTSPRGLSTPRRETAELGRAQPSATDDGTD